MRKAQVRKIEEIQQNDNGHQNIELHPVFLDLSPDHDPYIRHNGGSEEKQKMNIEQGFIGLLTFGNFLPAKQQKVSKSKEGGQIKQITDFKKNGRLLPSLMVPERP